MSHVGRQSLEAQRRKLSYVILPAASRFKPGSEEALNSGIVASARQPSSGINIAMPDDHPLTAPSAPRGAEALALRQADQASPEGRDSAPRAEARTDFAEIESNLEFIMSQLARVPTRKQVVRYSLLVIVGTACLVQTLAFLFR
jgi:hypothetical protein